ncbi:hypothetical protein [Arthrobacter sp.]|uniref:hypothetical protein n=1 Tax=Arthrobacter sp. TaxID=1667 RepID=UPI002810C59F|nr:hypothetical protein [Arthrobacter sp.]
MGTSDPDDIRIHSEAPVEGDDSRDFPEIRSHSQDPAEGSDFAAEGTSASAARPQQPPAPGQPLAEKLL